MLTGYRNVKKVCIYRCAFLLSFCVRENIYVCSDKLLTKQKVLLETRLLKHPRNIMLLNHVSLLYLYKKKKNNEEKLVPTEA